MDKETTSIVKSLEYVNKKFDIFSHYKVDQYLYGVGLCVNKAYRGRGIATELLRARESLLKTINLTVTSALFTTIASQKAALKADYIEKSSTSYEEIQSNFPLMNFSQANTSHCKTLVLKI